MALRQTQAAAVVPNAMKEGEAITTAACRIAPCGTMVYTTSAAPTLCYRWRTICTTKSASVCYGGDVRLDQVPGLIPSSPIANDPTFCRPIHETACEVPRKYKLANEDQKIYAAT